MGYGLEVGGNDASKAAYRGYCSIEGSTLGSSTGLSQLERKSWEAGMSERASGNLVVAQRWVGRLAACLAWQMMQAQ